MADWPVRAEMTDAQKLAFLREFLENVSWAMEDLRACVQRLYEKSQKTESVDTRPPIFELDSPACARFTAKGGSTILIICGRMIRFVWSVMDRFDYAITSVRLRVVDWICGPDQSTAADRQREAEHVRLQRAFPRIEIDRKG
jgi:hypothetical protein